MWKFAPQGGNDPSALGEQPSSSEFDIWELSTSYPDSQGAQKWPQIYDYPG